MCGIAENRLVEISNLDSDIAFFACKRAKIAKMAVTANPDWRTLGDVSAIRFAEPLVNFAVLPRT
jgi:hypothetical protein